MHSARNIVDLIKKAKKFKFDREVAEVLGMIPANLSAAIFRNHIPEKHFINYCIREKLPMEFFLSTSNPLETLGKAAESSDQKFPIDEEPMLNHETIRINLSNDLILEKIKTLKQIRSVQEASRYLWIPEHDLYHHPEAPLITFKAVIEFCYREKVSLRDFFSETAQPILPKRRFISPETLSEMPQQSFLALEMKENEITFYAAARNLDSAVSLFLFCFPNTTFFVPLHKLLDLKQACKNIRGYEFFVQKGDWTLQRLRFIKPFIRYTPAICYPTEIEFESFLTLISQINKSDEVTALINLAGLETYGSL
ncbi:MAG: hypothetical protein ACHQYP_09925 [Nitrospiria bacterium]